MQLRARSATAISGHSSPNNLMETVEFGPGLATLMFVFKKVGFVVFRSLATAPVMDVFESGRACFSARFNSVDIAACR